MVSLILFWVIFSLLVGLYYTRKGHSFAYGFFVSLFLSPLLGFLLGLFLEPNIKVIENRALQDRTMRKCPDCAELVKAEAIVCRHCGRALEPLAPEPPKEVQPPSPLEDFFKGKP